MIRETKDYDIFTIHEHNRPIVEGNIKKIIASITERNLLEYRPILVDKNMHVIDGQHRLEAAKRLGISIFYEVQKDLTCRDMILLNDNSKGWCAEDYLNYFVQEGNVEYIKMQSFMKKYNMTITSAFAVLGMKKAGGGKGNGDFKRGKFIFPSKAEEEKSIAIMHHSEKIISYIAPKLIGRNNYIKGASFRRALYVFLSVESVDFPTFMKKLAQRLDLIRPCARLADFLSIFKQIYNFRNQNPIRMDDEP